MMQRVCAARRAIVVALLAAVPLTLASIADPAVVVTASNADGTVQLPIPLSQFTHTPELSAWDYAQSTPVGLWAGTRLIAEVEYLIATLVDGPVAGPSITLQYALRAGASPTSFWVAAGPVSFVPIPGQLAAASMSDTFTLRELGYDADDLAELSALDNYAYQTYYGHAGSPGELLFHGSDSLGSMVGYGEGWTYTAYDNWPLVPGDYESLGISVDRIRTRAGFLLSLRDEVQVTTTFALLNAPGPDCNLNGVPDAWDIANRTSQDSNHNNIPDECEQRTGDLNCDGTYGVSSFRDINPFVLYLSDFSAWQATYPGCLAQNGDINGDGTYPSFKDVNAFVVLISGG